MSIGTNPQTAIEWLRKGKLVGVPTETVYGLAANAFDERAVLEIFKVKGRPDFDPLIVHAYDSEAAFLLASEVPEEAQRLAKAFWPGPLTLVLPKVSRIPDAVSSGLPTVGLRVPSHPMFRLVLEALDFPLAAPSANPFGYISPTTALHVEEQLGSKIPYILDGGDSILGVESTILGFKDGQVVLFRPGALDLHEVGTLLGYVPQRLATPDQKPNAPGMLSSHYAPKTALAWWDGHIPNSGDGVLFFSKPSIKPSTPFLVLSPKGDFFEAARHLYSHLREMDGWDLKRIWVERLPNNGPLHAAIEDRLNRAIGKAFSPL